MRTVLLFDIDGTLVSTGGAGRRAMAGAFARLHGKEDVFDGFSFAGMTDRAIARQGLHVVANAIASTRPDTVEAPGPSARAALEGEIDRVLETYLMLLERELATAAEYRVLPGVVALLEALRGRPNVAVGLGTGNVKRGAFAKLARGAIDGAFAFGGFGCDAEDRVELLRAGARRGAEMLGSSMENCRVVVIGDTPKDVAAAKGIGARSVGVGTGGYSTTDLLACGAHHVFETLADDGVLGSLFDQFAGSSSPRS